MRAAALLVMLGACGADDAWPSRERWAGTWTDGLRVSQVEACGPANIAVTLDDRDLLASLDDNGINAEPQDGAWMGLLGLDSGQLYLRIQLVPQIDTYFAFHRAAPDNGGQDLCP